MKRPTLASLSFVLLMSCSHKQDQTAATAKAATCEQGAAAYCPKVFECAPDDGRVEYGTVEECQRQDAAYCHQYTALPGVSSTAVQTWAACDAALAALTCEEFKYGGYFEACLNQPGARKLDEPCIDDNQCQSLRCKTMDRPADMQPELSPCGVCAPKGQAGQSCEGGYDTCVWGTECVDGIFVAPAKEGAACASDEACLYNLRCIEGACKKAAEVGGACRSSSDCAYWWASCLDGVCSAPEGIAEGQPCEPDGNPDMSPSCTSTTFCDPATKRCIRPRTAGQSCTSDFDCSYLLTCQGGTCAPLTDAICATAAPVAPMPADGSGGVGGAP